MEAAVRGELRSLGVRVGSVRARRALVLARKLEAPETSASGAAAVDRRLGAVMDEIRSLRVPAPETGEETKPAPEVVPADAVAKARAAREARRAGG